MSCSDVKNKGLGWFPNYSVPSTPTLVTLLGLKRSPSEYLGMKQNLR